MTTSLAVFTDASEVSGNTFSVGSVDISTDSDDFALFTTTDPMDPGDIVYEPIVVSNVGNMDLRYALTTRVTGVDINTYSLQQQLDLTVYSGVTGPQCSAGTVGGGIALYGPADLSGPGTTPMGLFGNTAPGDQAGDRGLAGSVPGPAGSETLCFVAALPLSTSQIYAGHQVTVRFDFIAEQTANN